MPTPTIAGPLLIGANACEEADFNYYGGLMDSVSVARFIINFTLQSLNRINE